MLKWLANSPKVALTNDRSTFFDWYNAFFEIRFKLDLKADGGDITDTRTTVINGSHSLINPFTPKSDLIDFTLSNARVKHMVVRSGGKITYDTDNLHLVTFAKNLLEYSEDYARSVAKNSLWYLDTADSYAAAENTGLEARRLLTADNADVDVTIPLNKYSFFEE